ncbi:MAG: RHS repeat-associated core domain-containing protein [Verrucomicrobia bacterium]|nr:RHS repeat-associated core domain-containing protein [Verrucomicrobiota bacterium]
MKTQITIKALGLSAIIFLLTLAHNTALACCPCETNINTLKEPGVESDFAGDPISLVSGKVLLEEKDLVLQTPILGLEFIRSWKSPGLNSSPLSGGWQHSYEWKVDELIMYYIPETTNTYQGISGEYVVVKIPVNPYDGAYKGGDYYFVRGANNTGLTTVSNVYSCVGRELQGARLYKMTNGTWELSNLSGNGVRYLFDTWGDLTQIVHPSSTSITLSYDSSKKLTNIAHSCGTSLSLSYSNAYLTQVRNNRDPNLWMEYSWTYYGTNATYSKMFQATRHISASSSDDLDFKYYYKLISAGTNNETYPLISRKVTPVGDEYLWRYTNNGSMQADGAWIVSGGITNNYGTTLKRSTNSQNTRMSVEIKKDRFGSIGYSTNTYMYDLVKMVPTNIVGPLPDQFEHRTYDNQNNLTEQSFTLNGDEVILVSSYDTNRNVIGLYSSYNSGGTTYLDYSLTWTTNRYLSGIRDALGRGYELYYYNTNLDKPTMIFAIDEEDNRRSQASFMYNSIGLPVYCFDGNGYMTTLYYSELTDGWDITVQPPLGYSKTIQFDYLWRPTQFSGYDSSGVQRTTYFQTDYAGRPLTITNPLNQVTSFQYDKAGRLIRAEDPSGRVVTNEWRLGKLVSQTVGKTGSSVSANVSLEYDPQMTMMKVKDPMNRYVETYGLDAAGQITTVTNLEGQTMTISRGVLGKVDQIDRFDNTSINIYYDEKVRPYLVYYPNSYYAYSYLSNGLLSSIDNGYNFINLIYDNWNDLVQLENEVYGYYCTTNNYAYDAEGNLTNKVLTVNDYYDTYTLINSTYLYDANERLTGEDDENGNPLWRYGYNPYSGQLAYATNMVTGIYCAYTYDVMGRIRSMTYNKSTRGWIPYYIYYSYDSSGRISGKDAYGGGQWGLSPAFYEYDELGRLSCEKTFDGSTNNYNYDLAGNRIATYNSYNSPIISYSTPTNNNRLATWGSNGSMIYDNAGCVTNLVRNTTTNISCLKLHWNGEYQLSWVEVVDTNNVSDYVTYIYDSLGRKFYRSDNETCEYYIYDGMNLVADYDAVNCRILRTYTYGPGVDNIQSMTIYNEDDTTETYYYIKDASNTVHVLVDEDGLIVEYYYYDAFGNLKIKNENYQWIPKSNYGNRFLFQGREYDYDTALYYFRARWYEPETGRWLSPDPIGISGGLNLYAFCGNDPVNFVDPMGLWPDWDVVGGYLSGFAEGAIGGAAMMIDDAIPFFDPFSSAYEDECGNIDDAYKATQVCAGIAGMALPIGPGKAKAAVGGTKVVGAYVLQFSSGMYYVGKGTRARMMQSARRIKDLHSTECVSKKFIQCENDKSAFIMEFRILSWFDGPKSELVYNLIQSPGMKLIGK